MSNGGTKIIHNGPESSEVAWGGTVRIAAWLATIVSGFLVLVASASVLRVFAMSAKLEVIEARQIMILDRLAKIEESVRKEDYLSHDEFTRWMASSERINLIRSVIQTEKVDSAMAAELKDILGRKRPPAER
jgi:hypothetical protein